MVLQTKKRNRNSRGKGTRNPVARRNQKKTGSVLALTYKLKSKSGASGTKKKGGKPKFATRVKAARARAARARDRALAEDDDELTLDQLREQLEIEDRLSQQNDEADMDHSEPKDTTHDQACDVGSQASELDLSDIEEAVVVSVLPDGPPPPSEDADRIPHGPSFSAEPVWAF